MSYDFRVQGHSKQEAISLVAIELERLTALKPAHSIDRYQVLDAAMAFINLLPEDAEKDVSVYVSGAGSFSGPGLSLSVNCCITTALVAREKVEA